MPSDVLGQAVHFLFVAMGMCGGCFRLFLIFQIIFSLLRKRHCTFLYTFAVATREGGVDRNGIFGAPQTFAERHRPQGVAQIKTTYPKSAESFW